MRIRIFFRIIVLILLIVFSCLFYTQIIRGDFYHGLSQKNRIRIVPQEAARGNILDNQGRVLVDSVLSFSASIIPQELSDKEKVFTELARILKEDKSNLQSVYKRGYIAPFAPVTVKGDLSKKEALSLAENKYKLQGLIVQAKTERRYPYGDDLSHIIGYLREADQARIDKLKPYGYKMRDIIGYSGLEEAYELFLRFRKGGMQIEVDNKGRMVRLLGVRVPEKGTDITLTIDLDMQRIASSALGDKAGCVIIMNPLSGAILAMASHPAYDPSLFVRNDRRNIVRLLNNADAPFVNRAISGLYPPASVFKLVTALAALESKKISEHTTFVCDGKMRVGGRDFKCWARHGPVDLAKAVAYSCDIFFYNAGLLAGPEALSASAFKFSLAHPTGIDLPQEKNGFVPTVNWKLKKGERWYKGDTVNFSIGQGDLLVTPIQMLRLVCVFANDGLLVDPYLVEKIGDKRASKKAGPQKLRINKKYLYFLKRALLDVVKDPQGTAGMLDIPGLAVAGKTGTAQVFNKASHGWFVGFAPADKPKIAFCVFIEHAGSSSVACSIVKEILNRFLEEDLI